MPHLLLLSATELEAQIVCSAFGKKERAVHAAKTVIRGELVGCECTLVFTGIGVANTAHALTCQLERRIPDLAIQFGIGGAYVPTDLAIGSVVVATEEIYGDVGVLTPDGWKPAEELGIPLVAGNPPNFNRFPLDRQMVETAANICKAQSGPFVTVSQCTGVQSVGDAIHARFGALCESMEGAAAAHVCALYSVPFLELRGISNLVEDRDRSRWQIATAARAVQQAVLKVIEHRNVILQE